MRPQERVGPEDICLLLLDSRFVATSTFEVGSGQLAKVTSAVSGKRAKPPGAGALVIGGPRGK